VNTAVGPIDAHMFVASPDPNIAYIVSYSDYPEEMVKKSDPQKMLDGARDGAAKNVNGKIESEKKIKIDGHPGRDFVIATERFQIRDRIYMVGSRLYQVMLVGSKDVISGKDAEKFIESFKLTEK
jgi:hypothetical protein